MVDYSARINELARREPPLTNAQIANMLGCSKRTVRRHAGPFSKRLKEYFGIEEADLQHQGVRILLLDIETAPMEVFVWRLRQSGWISPENVIKDWSMLCWCAKWLFDSKVMGSRVTAPDAEKRNDSLIVQPIWDLLNQADIVVAHNGANFDVRSLNARFAINGLNPPLPYRVVDTLRVVKKQFNFSSYKLDYVNHLFGLQEKTHPGYEVWKRSVKGDDSALKEMFNYCQNDVRILEDLYVQIRPWIKGHPNIGLYIDTEGAQACTNCGNTDLKWGGKYYTPAGRFLSFRCNSCGAVGRSRFSDLTAEERERICLSPAQ